MKARLLRGISANLYAQLVTSVVQIAAVPVLLRLWGSARYGEWVLLSAMPATLAFADGGLVLATGTAMTMAAARGDMATAARLHRRAALRVGGLVLGLAVVAALAIASHGLARLLGPAQGGEARPLLFVFVLVTLAGLLGTLPGAAFRADNRYAFGVSLGATLRAAETLAVLAAAATRAGLVAPAIAWLAARLVGVMLQGVLALQQMPWLRQPHEPHAPVPPLAPLLRPALAAVALPAGFSLSLQGVTVAAGLVLPPELVASFTATRTLCRLIVQLSGLVNHALMPELSRVASRRDQATVAVLLRLSRTTAAALLIPAWLLLLVTGPSALAAWTGGRLTAPPAVLPLVATAALLHGLWLARANMLLAVNRQADYAWTFLAVAALTVVGAAAAGRLAGVTGVAAATLAGEIAMAAWIAAVVRERGAGTVAGAEAALP